MKLVIDVPDYIYKLCQCHGDPVYKYIGDGTPIIEDKDKECLHIYAEGKTWEVKED